ncbi:Enamine deaminase RidA, house cleaning of reactive enamine intermediates, YjgF/YER057c/UK114 family [Pseudovibrio ascidiaceicola]|uniref:Enamine deaminase RidA, house cleaning of reactive enamine intermediates, YjgF/YER057c/UK114 family n=1 Tax=Pseudovibrio ascidiaceicola TaxID=285279 RepID=A0A1I3ZQI7_9HYPH|nr:RidA family protein [Pseudovibrio ascidiaceicola]SFK46237.1 Enamine deaminase RidA, house cleaning of reactive enamine intermediates, YjgF/YER057c/UK114 family [Pseudovibrio ascidiaceicola]
MSDIIRLNKGPRMSQIVVYNGIVHLSGQVDTNGKTAADQTHAILANIEKLLEEAGSNKSRILQATIWLNDVADFDEMNSVWDAWVDPQNPPARACGECKLALDSLKVEILITAAAAA